MDLIDRIFSCFSQDRREEINNIWLTYKKEKTILQAEQAKANLELQKVTLQY
jgi:hypothetical protein